MNYQNYRIVGQRIAWIDSRIFWKLFLRSFSSATSIDSRIFWKLFLRSFSSATSYNTFHKYGYAADPSTFEGYNYVGDLDRMKETSGILVCNIPQHVQKKQKIENKKTTVEENQDEVDCIEVENPALNAWLLKNRKSPWAGKKVGLQGELTEDQKKYAEEDEKRGDCDRGKVFADKSMFHGKENDYQGRSDKSMFHGKESDYQGRSWIALPKDAKATDDNRYILKKLVVRVCIGCE